MKNFKKVLCVVLVVAMAISLMTITIASAADATTTGGDTQTTQVTNINGYTDKSSISTYAQEAVDTLTAVGVLQGYDGAVFGPTNTLTREQAAKMITYIMIGTTAANALPHVNSTFTDVATDRWSDPFIAYCASRGIINGMGDGTFNPAAPISASQFAKLLLCAIGYGVNGEYTGANWEIDAIVDAQNKGILTLDRDYTQSATRQDIAVYAFNAINPINPGAVLVTWSSLLNSYITANGTIWSVNANGQTLGQKSFSLQQFSATDALGFNGHYWVRTYAPSTFITNFYADDAILGTSTNGTPLATLTNPNAVGAYKASLDPNATITYLVNGYTYYTDPVNATTSAGVALTGTAQAYAQGKIQTGDTVYLVDANHNGLVDKVIIVHKVVDTLSTAPVTNTAAGTVTFPGSHMPYSLLTVATSYPTGLAANTVILWYQDNTSGAATNSLTSSNTGNYNIQIAQSVTGQITNYSVDNSGHINSIVMNGTSITASGISNMAAYGPYSIAYNQAATVYLDDNGSFALLSTAPVAQNYAVLLSTSVASNWTAYAKLLLTNGTIVNVTVSMINGTNITTYTDVAALQAYVTANTTPNCFYSYAIDANGAYQLTLASQTKTAGTFTNTAVVNNTPNFAGLNGTLTSTGAAATYYGDSQTVFLVNDTGNNTYTAYTGIAAVPNVYQTVVSGAGSGAPYVTAIIPAVGTTTAYVFIQGQAIGATTSTYAYFYGLAGKYWPSNVAGQDYWTVPAIIKGTNGTYVNMPNNDQTTIGVKMSTTVYNNAGAAGGTAQTYSTLPNGACLCKLTYTGDTVTAITPVSAALATASGAYGAYTSIGAPLNGNVTIGNDVFTYDGNTQVFTIDTTGTVTSTTSTGIVSNPGFAAGGQNMVAYVIGPAASTSSTSYASVIIVQQLAQPTIQSAAATLLSTTTNKVDTSLNLTGLTVNAIYTNGVQLPATSYTGTLVVTDATKAISSIAGTVSNGLMSPSQIIPSEISVTTGTTTTPVAVAFATLTINTVNGVAVPAVDVNIPLS